MRNRFAFWLISCILVPALRGQNVEKAVENQSGTVVSSAYQLALDVIKQRYRPSDWNIYPFHFSDGDNYYSDNEEAVRLADELIATCNLFGYGEIGEEGSSSYRRSSGALLSIFSDRLQNKDRFVGVRIDDKEDVYPALKQFFGKRDLSV